MRARSLMSLLMPKRAHQIVKVNAPAITRNSGQKGIRVHWCSFVVSIAWLRLRRARAAAISFFCCALVCATATAAPSNDGILQQEQKQQQIRATTQRVGDQLA